MPLVRGLYPVINPEAIRSGVASPSAPIRESVSRRDVNTDAAALATGVMLSVAIPLQVGDVVSKLAFMSGATALGTGTHWWFALYDNSATPALLGQTADQTNGAWAADTLKDVALSAPVTILTSGVYYAACMVAATTPPTLVSAVMPRAAVAGSPLTGQKILAQTSGSALTTTAPATIASPTTVVNLAYAIAH